MKLPETVTTIGESAFYSSEGIKAITIPTGVTLHVPAAALNANKDNEAWNVFENISAIR